MKDYCTVVYYSKHMNVVGIVIEEENIQRLNSDPNVVRFHGSEQGVFISNKQPSGKGRVGHM
jgi:hypothetical protein